MDIIKVAVKDLRDGDLLVATQRVVVGNPYQTTKSPKGQLYVHHRPAGVTSFSREDMNKSLWNRGTQVGIYREAS
jgi:hypothetical protein